MAAEILGLNHAFEHRCASILPVLEILGKVSKGKLPQTVKLQPLLAKSRRLKRTFKGLQQVLEPFKGEPRGLESIGLDRVKQTLEEMRRLKGELISLTGELDGLIREMAPTYPIGPVHVEIPPHLVVCNLPVGSPNNPASSLEGKRGNSVQHFDRIAVGVRKTDIEAWQFPSNRIAVPISYYHPVRPASPLHRADHGHRQRYYYVDLVCRFRLRESPVPA